MASEEHKYLADFIKNVHNDLRSASKSIGTEGAWREHCKRKDVLQKYAHFMEKLATEYWDVNASKETSSASSRVEWTVRQCLEYFDEKMHFLHRSKEQAIADKINVTLDDEENFQQPFKILDVGSCYNPFKKYNFLDVCAIDLCPANNLVAECDFLEVSIGPFSQVDNNKVTQLKKSSFDAVTFCFLLEYIPSSELRIKACENAYLLLKPAGLLIINTPDSKHVGANCKIMKCWQYTLATIGFSRIKYEKLAHMHCMVFRKAINKATAVRWATLHYKPYMNFNLAIPQDNRSYQQDVNSEKQLQEISLSKEDFIDMPFNDTEIEDILS